MAAANTAIKAVADDLDAAVDDLNSISSKSNSCMGDLAHAAGGTSACVRVCVRECVRVCVRVNVQMSVCARARARVLVCSCA